MEDKTALVSVDQLQDLEIKGKGERQNATLIVIAGTQVGQMFKLDKTEIILGRATDADIRIQDDGLSRQHAQIRKEGDASFLIQDLGSTNGTYCNGERITAKALQDGDRVQIGTNTILKFSLQDDVEEEFQQRLFDSATRDGLTGCYNKKYFEERLETEFSYTARHGAHLSLVMFDIDHFKVINDTYGHLAGDEVLKTLAKIVNTTIRNEDTFARYGGEEFAVILREITLERAFIAAERIRRAVKTHEFIHNNTAIDVTISLGIATTQDGKPATAEELVMEADKYLYKAKESGRNATECAMFE